MSRLLKAHLALLVANLVYGANYTIAKEVMPEYIQPSGFILLRVLVALILFFVVHKFWVKERVEKKHLPLLFFCGITGVTVNQLLFFEGLALTTPINAALIMTTNPILVLIMAAIIIKEKITTLKVAGVIAGITGAIILILYRNNFETASGSVLGDVFIFFNAMSYGIYLVIVKPLMNKYNPITVMMWVFLFGSLFVIPFGYSELKAVLWSEFSGYIWMAVIYVVIATTFIAYLLNTIALRSLSPSIVSIYIYLQPLFATFVAMISGRDKFGTIHFISAALIFAGVFLVSNSNYFRRKKYL
ncbi:MAG: DMT family transporter [Bacteroidia bacterium]